MGLDDAVQDVAERLGRPILLFDTDLNVVAYSIHEGEVDRSRLAIILARKASPVAAEMITASKAKSSRGPVWLPAYLDVPGRILMPLRHHERLAGYLTFSEPADDPANLDKYTSALMHASDRLGPLLALRTLERRADAEQQRRLLADLLGSIPETRDRAAAELLASGLLGEAEQYSVLLFRARQNSGGPDPTTRLAVEDALKFAVQTTTQKACGSMLGADGVVVIPRTANPQRLAKVLEPATLQGINAGAGGPRTLLADAVQSYREADLAWQSTIRLPEKYGRSALWAELGLERLLLQLPLDTMQPADLPDSIQALLSTAAGITLASTLERYLACGGEAQETARRLHIHRSTLYYRLDRIRELIQSDLSDGEVRRELHTGILVARLAGLFGEG